MVGLLPDTRYLTSYSHFGRLCVHFSPASGHDFKYGAWSMKKKPEELKQLFDSVALAPEIKADILAAMKRWQEASTRMLEKIGEELGNKYGTDVARAALFTMCTQRR